MEDSYKHLIANPGETSAIYRGMIQLRKNLVTLTEEDHRFAPYLREAIAIFESYTADMQMAARDAAIFSERAIGTLIAQRQVRPPTGHSPGLAGSIKSGVVPATQVSFAQAEIAHVKALDQTRNPFARSGAGQAPYWWSQEFGNTKNVGRRIQGLFVGGGAAPQGPNAGAFRVHSMFAASNKPGVGGTGQINRAIQPKWFLRDGTDATEVYWREMVAIANAACVRKLGALMDRLAALGADIARRRIP